MIAPRKQASTLNASRRISRRPASESNGSVGMTCDGGGGGGGGGSGVSERNRHGFQTRMVLTKPTLSAHNF